MRRGWLAVIVVVGALTISADFTAAQGKKKGNGNPHAAKAADDHGRRGDRDDDRWERRGNYEYRMYGDRDGRPPGWSEGRKTGWANCGLPPGQAKKYGCRTYIYQGRRYYYYRDDHARIIVRRPSIHVRVDIH